MFRRAKRPVLFASLALALGGSAFFSCTAADDTGDPGVCTPQTAKAAPATEWIGFHTEVPLVFSEFHALASGLFGAEAKAGKFVVDREITPGVFLTASAETTTPDQARLTLAFDDDNTPRRPVAVAPTSFAVGGVFIAAVDAAIAKMQADNAAEPGSGETFFLEYRVASAQGGKLSFGVRGEAGVYTLVVDVTSPRTGLEKDKIGKAIDEFSPTDSVAGTVWFHLSKDDFDFFTAHAYGQGATSKQNFKDFKLLPHDWLRLTVEPHLDEKFVDVGFEVMSTDGKRIPVAKAPASILAGDAFRSLVLRNVATMDAQEKAKAGSSTPWRVPFYYDHPDGGGVVQVIAEGKAGSFAIAYSIESPQSTLKDVPFVPYQDVVILPPDPSETASCEKLGDPTITLAAKGTLNIEFSASDTIKNSTALMGPLVGTIYCDVFHKKDVELSGPVANATVLESFSVPMADLEGKTPPSYTTIELFAGEYQVLCAQDLDNDGTASFHDPVTLPIGGYTVACNKNPVTVEFAILNPLK